VLKKTLVSLASLSLVVAAALFAPSADTTDGVPKYQPVANWPQLPENVKLGPVAAVATDSAGRVLVFHRGKQPIMVFDRDGKFLRSWGDDVVKTAHGLRVDAGDNVWTTDIGNHLVTKFDPKGKVLLTLGKKDQPGDGPDQFNKPTDTAVAANGDVYVSDGYGNSRVVKFSKDGKFLKEWGKRGTGEGEFHIPHVIQLDAKGRVYVGDRENNRVQLFDPDGKFLAQWKDSGAPYGLFLTMGGRVLVADGRGNDVRVLDASGKVLGRWGEKGTGAGQFSSPHWICADAQGAIYVAETGANRVQKFVAK
jgi:DNA-binding beta-propeller fold protein YncE